LSGDAVKVIFLHVHFVRSSLVGQTLKTLLQSRALKMFVNICKDDFVIFLLLIPLSVLMLKKDRKEVLIPFHEPLMLIFLVGFY